MILKTISDFVPTEVKNKVVHQSIEAIGYFRRAYKIKSAFSAYLDNSYSRLSWMKTLLYRNEPIRLSECYVRNSVTFRDNNQDSHVIEDYELLNFILNKKRIIISGSAGVGKSVLCKSIFLEMINKANGIYPIFIELRELKHYPQFSLLDYICSEISNVECKINPSNLEQLIKQGNILLVFDGFDELDFDIRSIYTKQILWLSNKYHKINILISSRPDENLKSWSGFYEVNVNSLDKKKAIELISKLRYEDNIKRQFIKKIDDELYESHKSFIGNPLLLTMMLMTFQEFAEIPKKIYLFYEQAFQTLFLKHDSLKDLYIRKSYSGMDIHEFKKVFSYFCINTQLRKKITMTEDEAVEFIKSTLRHFGKSDIKPEYVLNDLMSNLCILHRDGKNITFSHRSFQEYFAALYLKDCSYSEKLYPLIDKVVLSNHSNICSIVYDMNPELLEKVWIYPKIEIILKDIKNSELTLQDKESIILRIINSLLCIKDKDGKTYLFYESSSEVLGYNYIGFHFELWVLFLDFINFSKEEVRTMLSLNKEVKSLKLIKILNDYILEFEQETLFIKFSEMKEKLNYDEYYYFINYLYNDIVLKKESHLVKIRDYISRKKSNGEMDIEQLLDI